MYGKFTQQCSRLQCHASRMNVLDELSKYIRFELYDGESMVLIQLWLTDRYFY